MTTGANVFDLLVAAPKDHNGELQAGPETSAFLSALATAAPATPLELLGLANAARADPARASSADFYLIEALSLIGHDRQFLVSLAKISGDATSWGITVGDLFRQVQSAFQTSVPAPTTGNGTSAPPAPRTAAPFPIGVAGGHGGSTAGWSIPGCTFEGITCPAGKKLIYPIPPGDAAGAAYLGATSLTGFCLNGRLFLYFNF